MTPYSEYESDSVKAGLGYQQFAGYSVHDRKRAVGSDKRAVHDGPVPWNYLLWEWQISGAEGTIVHQFSTVPADMARH